jgi:hypothetical protein
MNALVMSFHTLGRCPYCIRKSFQLAVFGWFGAVISFLLLSGYVGTAAAIFALLPTLLWLAHLAGYVTNASSSTGESSKIHSLSEAIRLSASFPNGQTPCPLGCPSGQQCCVRTDFNNQVIASGCCQNCYVNCVF